MASSPLSPSRIGRLPMSAVWHLDELIVAIDLPGVDRDHVDVWVDEHVLEVKAHRGPTYGEVQPIIDEHAYGDVHCRFLLAADLDARLSTVEMDNGVLAVTLLVDGDRTQRGRAGEAVIREEPATEPEELVEAALQSAQTQVDLLQELIRSAGVMRRETVPLKTSTGVLAYALPLSLEETYNSSDVGAILSPSGQGHRSIAQLRRKSNELLGIKIGNKYLFPKFQINRRRREIIPVVKYANTLMESDEDPWGTLDWWYSAEEAFDDRRPVDLVEDGELTAELVELAIGSARQGME
jgi:HSP20 family molecular chaperone IbpA